MTTCDRSDYFFMNRKRRRDRILRKCAAMRAAKERKRLANPLVERDPKLVPFYPLQFGVRDKRTGDVAFVDFKSVRDAARRLSVIKRYYL